MTRPHGICQACFDEQVKTWPSQFWLWCRHFRVMARRRRVTDPWTLDRGVTPEKATNHIAAAVAKMAENCAKKGQTLEESFALVQALYQHEQAKRGPQ